ncbi:MAG: M24 family metallopeptidase [Candidatus Hodarchaeota archaeon]
MRSISKDKYETLVNFLQEKQIDLLLILDSENSRNINLQYLSGHPTDAIIIITSNGESILIPWDIALAEKHSEVDEILDPCNFQYNTYKAIKHLIEEKWKKSSITVGVHEFTPYGFIIKTKKLMPEVKFFKEPIQINRLLQELRATKNEYELNQLIRSAQIGSDVIQDIRKFCENAGDDTEQDLSFLVRKKMLEYGADDIAFESLVANTNRSHEIHCYPFASNQMFALQGLALIDFGAKYHGYCSDITVPISFGTLSEEQQKMRDITLKSYETAIEMIDIGVPFWKVHEAVEEILKKEGYIMPYALGHGLGLSEHDSPIISQKPTDEYSLKYWKEESFQNGMVFTIEPGVYKQGWGGFRIENDVIIRNNKVEIITKSQYLQIT